MGVRFGPSVSAYLKPVMNSAGDIVGLIVENTVSILEIVDYHK